MKPQSIRIDWPRNAPHTKVTWNDLTMCEQSNSFAEKELRTAAERKPRKRSRRDRHTTRKKFFVFPPRSSVYTIVL